MYFGSISYSLCLWERQMWQTGILVVSANLLVVSQLQLQLWLHDPILEVRLLSKSVTSYSFMCACARVALRPVYGHGCCTACVYIA